jgi:glycosyltransferase involved in cell wall biosynthesis
LNASGLRDKTSIDTEFLLPDGTDEFENKLCDDGFQVHRPNLKRLHPPQYVFENIIYGGQFPIAVYRILNLIRTRGIDIVHVNSPLNLYPAVAGWLSNASVAWHFNGYNFPSIVSEFIKQIAPILADEFVFSSSIVRDHIFEDDSIGRVIFPPVDTERFNPATVRSAPDSDLRSEFGINPDTPILGTVGNITPAKDHERLLRAIRRVVDQGDDVAVPIVGGVSDTKQAYGDRVRALCDELNLSDHVYFLGWRSDVRKILTDFDLFVLSSKMETGPMALMEAMAMEVPVVTTRVGVVRDIDGIEDVAWVATPESTSELSEALQQALRSNERWTTTGERSRQFAKKWFSLQESVEKHRTLYQDLI